jgi:hypothetical protein
MAPDDLTAEQVDDAMHTAVRDAGMAFARALWGERSFTPAWPHLDPVLRRCLAQTWLLGQEDLVRREGFEPDDVVEAFAVDQPEHPLWAVFEELQLPDLLAWWPGADAWLPTTKYTVLDLDVESFYLVPPPAEGEAVPEDSPFLLLVMRYDREAGWRVLNFFSEAMPVPGWPPRM